MGEEREFKELVEDSVQTHGSASGPAGGSSSTAVATAADHCCCLPAPLAAYGGEVGEEKPDALTPELG